MNIYDVKDQVTGPRNKVAGTQTFQRNFSEKWHKIFT